MNFKEALRKDTNYLRGLSYLDNNLRQNWINQNAARLRRARDILTTDDYKAFAEDLYRLQIWNNLEAENINKGVYGQNFRPTREYIQNYFNKKIADIDFTIKYHPDLDENNVYVGSKKNTGLSPEMWNIYSNLKDEESKREFRERIRTENQVWDDAAQYQANEKSLDKSTTVSAMQQMGVDMSGMSEQIMASNFIATTDENHPDNVDYLKKNKDKITADSYAFVNNKNTETARNIWSRSLKKYRQSKEYQKAFNAEMKSISDRLNIDPAKDKNGAETAFKDEFLEAIKENPVLSAASGYDPKTGKFSHEQFQQYESLLEEDTDFKAKYVAHKNTLAKQVQAGLISEDDYKQSLIDIANDSLKDHEEFLTRAANATRSALTTGLTYTLHKFAPYVNTAEVLNKQTDGKIFMDTYGNIYKDSDITSNAQYTNPKDADSATLYKTSNGVSINYNRDGDKIFVKDGISYIYQNEDGTFRAVDSNSIDVNDEHLRKVNAIEVKNTPVGTHDLVRLGKDDSGNDLNWAGGIFNERYLQMSDRYNVMPWNHEELDYYNQFGYSKYVNIQRPGDDSRDFWGETIKMMGFVGADLLMTFATRGAGKALGAGMRTMRGIELGTSLLSSVGISDSYAQGLFEEDFARNEQTLQNIISGKAKDKAEAWANTEEGQKLLNQMYAEAVKTQEKEFGRPLTETEKAQLQMAVRAQAVGARAMQHYAEDIQHPDVLKMQEQAVSEAGNAALVDFWGEGLKYGLVNTAGFRSWMFKSRNAAEQAARASEKSLLGKAFSRVGTATQKEVDAGLAKSVGDVYLKDAWSTMSKAQKARAVLGTTGKQFWGGAWTNWTDEMQSAGAKAQNNSNFDAHLDNNNPNGVYLFANAIASQLQGIKESAFDENSLWAGLIGGAGSVMGFGFNPMGIIEAATNKKSWNNMSTGEKFNSIFSNSVLSEVYQQRANDYQAQQMLDRANALLKSVDGNTISIINAFQSASRIGHSENTIAAEEENVKGLFHTLVAIDNFSKTNPGLAELDSLTNIKNFAENAEKLSDLSKLSDEEKQGYIEQIKVSNPNMTEAEATAELENVSKRAQLMQKMLSDWTNLQKSEEYKKAASKTEEKSKEQENMEEKLVLQTLQDYTLQNMREREQKINGSTSIATIDGITTATAESTIGGETVTHRVQENNELATYGNTKEALKNIKESYKILASNLEQRKSNMEKAKANLKFEEKAKALKEQINNTISPTEKQDLQKKLADLIRDNSYYTSEIARIDNELNENANQQSKLEALFDNAKPDSETVLTAREILNLDPVARMRMLDSNNFNNYSEKQQTQIKKAIAELSKKGLDFSDIQNQALASSRYIQRESMLEALAHNETVKPSFKTRVTNMIDAANKMILSNVKQYSRKAMEEINDNSTTKEEAAAKKRNLLKGYSASILRYIKDGLNKSDQSLVDEVLPIAETGEQLIDLIYNENYGLTGLNLEGRRNLQRVVADTVTQSGTVEELINNLAQTATNTFNPSINTLLDKLGQVYEQQHSTVVETAKEKAQRQAEEKKATQAREQAAQTAVAPAENAPSVSTTTTTENPATETPVVEPVTIEPTPVTPEVPTTHTTEAKTDAELIQEVKNTIIATQAQVQPIAERDPHADHYLINGEKYIRVHSAMGDVWVGPNRANKEANSARSLKNGSIVDSIVRDFFNGITPAKPNHFSDEAFASLMTSLETIKAKLIENGEEFLTNNIVLYHKFPNGVKIAGEADIVSIKIVDGKPQYNIYDLKTSAGGRDGKAFNESSFWETNPNAGTRNTVIGTREQYTNQVSLYKLLFERMFNNSVTNLALLPYKLTYDAESNVTGIEKYSGIALTYNPNVEKLIAYQPAIDDAISRIQHTYKGIFTKEQLATLKGIIANGIIKGEAFGKDVAYFINNQGLEAQFKEVGMGELSPIIKDLKGAISNINVAETLKEEFKEPEPLPTPTPPAELATIEPTGNEYSPTKESFSEPDVDAEFNAVGEDTGSTQLQQTLEVTEEDADIDLTTNTVENIDINEETGEVATTIKGNAMSPYVYEDKATDIEENKKDVQRGILVNKTPGESMQNFNNWMQSRKIDLQGLIDNKLSDILSTGTKDNPVKIFFMRVNPNMTATGGHLMKDHYLLVVEDTPALRDVYTQEDANKYGDFIKANGKQYLIIGTAGFANSSQGNAYRNIFIKGPNSVQVKSNAYFKANASEEFYVDQDKYTHVARVHSGFITKQLATDSMPQVRRLSELLNDSERNPLGLTWDSLVFGYQMRSEFRTVPDVDSSIYHAPAKAMYNIGNVFLYIKGADGKYTPTMLIPTRYLEISQGALKTEIENALRMLTSLDHAQRYKGLLELFNLVVLGQKDYNGVVTGTNILIGTDKIPSLKFMLDGHPVYETNLNDGVDFQEVLKGFGRLNPRISVTKSKLLNEETLKKLDAAGALRTDIARLGKASGDYAVYNIGSDGKPIITAAPITSSNAEIIRGDARRIRVDEQYYSKMGDSYIDEGGNIVTDSTLLESIKLNDFILNNNIDASITIDTTEYFISNMSDTQSIIARETGTHKASIITDAIEISKVKEAIAKEKTKEAQASRDAAASAELESATPTVKSALQISVKSDTKSQTGSKTGIQDLLDMDKKLDSKKENSKQQIDTIDHKYIGITGNTVTTKVERTPILLKDLKPGDHFFNHRNERCILIESFGNDEYGIDYDGTNILIGPELAWGDWVSSNPKVYRVAKKEATASSNSISTTSESSTSSQNINVTERKSLVDINNSGERGTFVEEKDALQILQDETFQDAVLDECIRLWPEVSNMTFGEIVEFLKSKEKVTTGIKDVQVWIDTLKC